MRHRWSLAALSLALFACGAPGAPGEPLGQTESALSANDQTAFDFFLGKGLTNFQAAGIVGNLDQESGMDPTIEQSGGGPGRGIAQWSVGGRWDTDPNENVLAYATMEGQSPTSLGLQLDFIWYELTTFPGYGLAALEGSTNVTDATIAFEMAYEGCGTCDQSQRVAYAQAALTAYGADKVDGGPLVEDAGTSCMVPGIDAPGQCILTTDCAALPNHVSTPGYCPGPTDIECCTATAAPGAPDASTDGATAGDGATPHDSGAASADAAHEDGSEGGPTGPKLDPGATGGGGSRGCSVAPQERGAPDAAMMLAGLGLLLVARRPRRRSHRA